MAEAKSAAEKAKENKPTESNKTVVGKVIIPEIELLKAIGWEYNEREDVPAAQAAKLQRDGWRRYKFIGGKLVENELEGYWAKPPIEKGKKEDMLDLDRKYSIVYFAGGSVFTQDGKYFNGNHELIPDFKPSW